MKIMRGFLSLAILLLAVACRGGTPEPGPDVLATDRTPVILATGVPTRALAGTASSTATPPPLPTVLNPLVRTQAAEWLEDEPGEDGPAVLLPTDTPAPTRSPTPTVVHTPTPTGGLGPSATTPPPPFASMPTLLSAPWRVSTPSAPLRQAVFLVDEMVGQYRYLPGLPSPGSPDLVSIGQPNLVPLSSNCKQGGVGFANFANLIICASGLEGGEDQALVTDMFGKHIYHTLGPEVGWRWSPDDLHLIAEPDEERGRKGTIYHLMTGELEDWPYTCDRVALSPRSGRLATWCRSVPEGEAFGVIEWGGKTWISPQAPAEALVQTTPEDDRPGWLWGWAADGERIAYFDPGGSLTIADARGAPLLVLPDARDQHSSIHWAANGESVLLDVRGRADRPCPTYTGEYTDKVYENPPCWQVIDAQNGAVIWHQADVAKIAGLEAEENSYLLEGGISHTAISADGRYLAMYYYWNDTGLIVIVDVDTNTLVWRGGADVGLWGDMRWAEVPSDVSAPPWPPTPIAAAAPSATPTPAALQGLTLADPAALQTILWDYRGLWSPAYDEMVGQHKQPGAATIGLATAPDFSLRKIDLSQSGVTVFDPVFTWSLDGNNILFLGPGGANAGYLWRMDRKGGNPRLVISRDEAHFWQRFAGWLDERSVAVVEDAGEGTSINKYKSVYIIDFLAGKLLSWASVNGPIFTPNRDYLPGADKGEPGWFFQYVLARQAYTDDTYTLDIPVSRYSTVFRDWLPGTNQMLVQAFTDKDNDGYPGSSRLLLWDVEADEVRDLVMKGVDGKYSPDGRWLAAVTLGALPLNEDGTFEQSRGEVISKGAEPFLYLLEAATGKVILNTAIIAAEQGADSAPTHVARMAFSPDGHYLAFAAPGQVVTDESGWPMGLEGDAPSLNVLDLSQRRLLRSLPGDGLALAWSPAGDRLAYRDARLQWRLYDPNTDALLDLTTRGGEMVERLAWSHTGRYLALYVTQEDGATHTVVLWMGE